MAAHADEMFAVLGDPALYEYENAPPASSAWLRERFARLESRRSANGEEQWLNWVIRLGAHGLIGFVQATVFPTGRAAIAYVLSSKHWGAGYAHEACEALIRELREHHHVQTFHAVFKRRNLRSLRVLERLGFVPAPAQTPGSPALEADESLMVLR